ncbi:hypothetical protein DPMN_084820 [Dreissena polymorpha]|uniref:Uncharacterized protein n=1 Tax=Dreissena polymorpha TaxID=45954 RepID=A0A9D3YF86_DREPO|nr:hypothetical protein DPMN_084820 [Dreissena polymorpha]
MSPDGRVNFTESGTRRSLCEYVSTTHRKSQGLSTYITEQTSSSEEIYTDPQYIEDTTTLEQTTRQTNESPTLLQDEANQMLSKSTSAVTIGITVPIGVIVILSVTIVLILLKRRRLLPCIKNRSANKASDKLDDKTSNQESSDVNGEVHNFFVLEKCVYKTTEAFDNSEHYNDVCDTNEPEGDHTFVANDKQEQFDDGINAPAIYNYTRVVKAAQRVTRSPDNIYNKMSVDHHTDYDHLGTVRQDQTVGIETSDEYNTTAAVLAVTKGFRGDASAYNQVNFNRNKLHASGNDLRDYVITDYDVTQQAEFRFETEDMSGYAHVSKDC